MLDDTSTYRIMIHALQYCMVTYPYIIFDVSKLYQFLSSSTNVHLKAIKKVLCYLKSTVNCEVMLMKTTELDLLRATNSN